MGIDGVIARRRAERDALLRTAGAYEAALAGRLSLRAAVVFGSVARGDFNQWSDIDVLVIAENLPDNVLGRLDALGPRPAGIQPIAWTPDEWRLHQARNNPIAIEASSKGVWLRGSPEELPSADAARPTVENSRETRVRRP